jgi:hypothetical protein
MIRKNLAWLAALVLLMAPAEAQVIGGGGSLYIGAPVSGGVSGNCLYVTSSILLGQQSCGGTITIGSTPTSGGAAGQIPYDTGSVITESSSLVFASNNLTIGNPGSVTGSLTLGNASSGSALLTAIAANNLRIGGADAASPASQTISVPNVLAGTSNTAGVDTYFQASAGTGTGVGGMFHFQTAVAGSTGSTQNALADEFTLDGAAGATFYHGGNSTPQVTFAPNSGNAWSLGMANSGSILIAFVNSSGTSGTWSQDVGFTSKGLVVTNGNGLLFSANGTQVTTTNYSGLWECATASSTFPCVAVGNGGTSQDFSGTLKLASIQLSGGTKPTLTTGSCSGSSAAGGATAGTFVAAACTAGTYILSGLPAAPVGYVCDAHDQTTSADLLNQTASSTTSVTLTGTTLANDVIAYKCIGF